MHSVHCQDSIFNAIFHIYMSVFLLLLLLYFNLYPRIYVYIVYVACICMSLARGGRISVIFRSGNKSS